MRIQEILIESHQLDEGPILNKIGTAVGKGVGTLAKGVGAVAGGVAGLGSAVKKGFRAGKATVGGGGDADPAAGGAAPGGTTAAPAAGGAPAGKPKGFLAGVKAGQSQGMAAFPNADEEDPEAAPAPAAATTPPSATDINKAGPKGTAQAKPIQGTMAKQAAAKTGAALAGQDQAQAGQTMYTQVKANIDKLDKKGKQRILQLLQKSMAAPAAGGAAPATAPGGAMGAMAQQLGTAKPAANTMANAPVSKTNTAKPGNPNAAPAGNYDGKTGAPLSDKAKADAEFDASPEGKAQQAKVDAMGTTPAPQTTTTAPAGKKPVRVRGKKAVQPAPQQQMAGKINTGSMVLEGFNLFRKK